MTLRANGRSQCCSHTSLSFMASTLKCWSGTTAHCPVHKDHPISSCISRMAQPRDIDPPRIRTGKSGNPGVPFPAMMHRTIPGRRSHYLRAERANIICKICSILFPPLRMLKIAEFSRFRYAYNLWSQNVLSLLLLKLDQ